MKKIFKFVVLLLFVLLFVIWIFKPRDYFLSVISSTGTYKVNIYSIPFHVDAEALEASLSRDIQLLEARFSSWMSESIISRLNTSEASQRVKLSDDELDIFKMIKGLSGLSEELFQGVDKLMIYAETNELGNPDRVKIDLSKIQKGITVELLVKLLRYRGVQNALISAPTGIGRVVGKRFFSNFKYAYVDPKAKKEKPLSYISLKKEQALISSIDGLFLSVSNAIKGEALSLLLKLTSKDKWKGVLEKNSGLQYHFELKAGEPLMSKSFKEYIDFE